MRHLAVLISADQACNWHEVEFATVGPFATGPLTQLTFAAGSHDTYDSKPSILAPAVDDYVANKTLDASSYVTVRIKLVDDGVLHLCPDRLETEDPCARLTFRRRV
jgi:hypothetical protein